MENDFAMFFGLILAVVIVRLIVENLFLFRLVEKEIE